MTAAARIKQSDVERVTKGVLAAGVGHARMIVDLANSKIEVIIGEAESAPPVSGGDGWDDDD